MSPRGVVLAVALMLFVSWALPAVGQPVVGGQAPGFDLPALGGARVSDQDYRGRIVVLHFGAGW